MRLGVHVIIIITLVVVVAILWNSKINKYGNFKDQTVIGARENFKNKGTKKGTKNNIDESSNSKKESPEKESPTEPPKKEPPKKESPEKESSKTENDPRTFYLKSKSEYINSIKNKTKTIEVRLFKGSVQNAKPGDYIFLNKKVRCKITKINIYNDVSSLFKTENSSAIYPGRVENAVNIFSKFYEPEELIAYKVMAIHFENPRVYEKTVFLSSDSVRNVQLGKKKLVAVSPMKSNNIAVGSEILVNSIDRTYPVKVKAIRHYSNIDLVKEDVDKFFPGNTNDFKQKIKEELMPPLVKVPKIITSFSVIEFL